MKITAIMRYTLTIITTLMSLSAIQAENKQSVTLSCKKPGRLYGYNLVENLTLKRANKQTTNVNYNKDERYPLRYELLEDKDSQDILADRAGAKGFIKACQNADSKGIVTYTDEKGKEVTYADGENKGKLKDFKEVLQSDELVCYKSDKGLPVGDMQTYIKYPDKIKHPYKYNDPNNFVVNEASFSKICGANGGTHYVKKSTGEKTPVGYLSRSGWQDILDTVDANNFEYYKTLIDTTYTPEKGYKIKTA